MQTLVLNVNSRQAWHAVRWALAGLVSSLLILFLFDVIRPEGVPLTDMIFMKALYLIPLLGAASLLLFAASWALPRLGAQSLLHGRLSKAGLVVGFVFLGLVALMLLDWGLYKPIKFRYLIFRVEHAQTAVEEKAAFALAARWGRVWEVNRIPKSEGFPARVRHLKGDWILELEWLECWPSGTPYRAYRQVTDEQNLRVLARESPRKRSAHRNEVSQCLT